MTWVSWPYARGEPQCSDITVWGKHCLRGRLSVASDVPREYTEIGSDHRYGKRLACLVVERYRTGCVPGSMVDGTMAAT